MNSLRIHRVISLSTSVSLISRCKLSLKSENFAQKFLQSDNIVPSSSEEIRSRIVRDVHYSLTLPRQFPNMRNLVWNASCQDLIEPFQPEQDSTLRRSIERLLRDKEHENEIFSPFYSLLYGKTSNRTWQGLYGDGRVITVGEYKVKQPSEKLFPFYDLQIKGSGPTPFSQGYDGKGSLRGSLREFLGAEISHNLNIRTARCLQLIETNEKVIRRWYHTQDTYISLSDFIFKEKKYARHQSFTFSPRQLPTGWVEEPGGISSRLVGCPIRFSHFETFRRSTDAKSRSLLSDLTLYSLYRMGFLEYASDDSKRPRAIQEVHPSLLKGLLEAITDNSLDLIIGWERVGYINGSLSSDNILISGENFDFGPYNFLESYLKKNREDFLYKSSNDKDSNEYHFNQQSHLVLGYLAHLKDTFQYILRVFYNENFKEEALEIQKDVLQIDLEELYKKKYLQMVSNKLGLLPQNKEKILGLWTQLECLLEDCHLDYTIFFDSLSCIDQEELTDDIIYRILEDSTTGYSQAQTIQARRKDWKNWMQAYHEFIREDNSSEYRRATMRKSNPTFILRNWMPIMAYEGLLHGDTSILQELFALCQNPYAEGSEEQRKRWRRSTPAWAMNSPGVAYLSCSS